MNSSVASDPAIEGLALGAEVTGLNYPYQLGKATHTRKGDATAPLGGCSISTQEVVGLN